MLHLNTCIFTILNELRLDILTTIVRSKDLEFPPRLVFNQGSKDFEEVKKLYTYALGSKPNNTWKSHL